MRRFTAKDMNYLSTARENHGLKKLIECFPNQFIIIADAFTQFLYNGKFMQPQLCWVFKEDIPNAS